MPITQLKAAIASPPDTLTAIGQVVSEQRRNDAALVYAKACLEASHLYDEVRRLTRERKRLNDELLGLLAEAVEVTQQRMAL